MKKELTNKKAIKLLNEIGPPSHDHPENGGRVSWQMVTRYGEWLYRHDKIAFHYAKQDLRDMF